MMKRAFTLPGFTLTELLVVLALIALLAALLFPLFAASRRRAQQTACLSNLQQLSHALSMYTADYDGAYPLGVTGDIVDRISSPHAPIWEDLLLPYIHAASPPACPCRDWPFLLPASLKSQSRFTGYALNRNLNHSLGNKNRYILEGKNEAVAQHTASIITLAEARIGIHQISTPDTARSQKEMDSQAAHIIDKNREYPFFDLTPGAIRHEGGANYAFADGHTQWLRPTQISTDKHNDGITPGFGL